MVVGAGVGVVGAGVVGAGVLGAGGPGVVRSPVNNSLFGVPTGTSPSAPVVAEPINAALTVAALAPGRMLR